MIGDEGAAGQAAYAAALSGLPGMGPATLVAVLGRWEPRRAWERVRAGRLQRPPRGQGLDFESRQTRQTPLDGAFDSGSIRCSGRTWAELSRGFDPETWWAPIAGRGIGVTWPGLATYPVALADDPHPPGVLFWRGALECLDRPCVAIVGTRRATPDGRSVAFELGRDLAGSGICVVSGLALGIDGAAHLGSLRAVDQPGAVGPVGVAASGVDVVYPRRHAGLWEQVVAAGAVVSETPPGRPAQAWRFPARNRVIAGLVRMVVVVESHAAGGSLITVEAALERGVEVRVVPGPVHSPASAGTNQLLYDGPGPVRSARDVLDALGMFLPDSKAHHARAQVGVEDEASLVPVLSSAAKAVLAAVEWRPSSLNHIVDRSATSVGTALRALDELEATGWVASERGWWVRRR